MHAVHDAGLGWCHLDTVPYKLYSGQSLRTCCMLSSLHTGSDLQPAAATPTHCRSHCMPTRVTTQQPMVLPASTPSSNAQSDTWLSGLRAVQHHPAFGFLPQSSATRRNECSSQHKAIRYSTDQACKAVAGKLWSKAVATKQGKPALCCNECSTTIAQCRSFKSFHGTTASTLAGKHKAARPVSRRCHSC